MLLRRINHSSIKSFTTFIRPYRIKLLFVFVLFVISNTMLAVIPIFIGSLIDQLSVQPLNPGGIWLSVWILVALSSLHDVIWRGAEFAYRRYLNEISFRYETFLFDSVVRRPYPYFVDKMSGKISSYITQISQEFRNMLSETFFGVSGQVIGLIATILILGNLNWQSQVIFIAGLVGMLLVGRFTLRYNMRHEAKATDLASTKNGVLFDAIANYPSIKAFASEATEIRTIQNEQQKTIDANHKAFFTGIIFWASMSLFVRHFIWAAILIVNAWFFIDGQLSIGQFATLLSAILLFSAGIWELVWHTSQFGQKFARINEAHTYLFGDEAIEDEREVDIEVTNFERSIRLDNVSFAYPDKPDVDVLKNISLNIRHGEKIGIVGRSGSGKSTLTKILLNFYAYQSGSIQIDGRNSTLKNLASHISFVPQDTALFHRSIRDNIAYGSATSNDADIIQAARDSSAHDFVQDLPNGYDTLVGERGVKLSGGQRQRIAIARAFLQHKPILLLDEATSALDSESEIAIQQALNNLWRDKTVIAIAHRLSTLRHMDRIIVMDDGRIIEEGSHATLLANKGTYAKLWNHQSGGFIEE